MIYKASLKLTTNFLGGGSRKKGMSVRPLIYTEEGLVAINEEEWRSNIALALKQLNLKFVILNSSDKHSVNEIKVDLLVLYADKPGNFLVPCTPPILLINSVCAFKL